MDVDDFTIPYIIDTIPNSPEGYQLSTQAKKKNVLLITMKKTHHLQSLPWLDVTLSDSTWKVQSKYNLVQEEKIPTYIFRRNFSRFDQIIILVSHLEAFLPYNTKVPNNIEESLKGLQYQLWKAVSFVQ